MIKVLSQGFPGHLLICEGCGSLLSYQEADIYGTNLVYCPLCKFCNQLNYDRNYDGLVKEEKKNV